MCSDEIIEADKTKGVWLPNLTTFLELFLGILLHCPLTTPLTTIWLKGVPQGSNIGPPEWEVPVLVPLMETKKKIDWNGNRVKDTHHKKMIGMVIELRIHIHPIQHKRIPNKFNGKEWTTIPTCPRGVSLSPSGNRHRHGYTHTILTHTPTHTQKHTLRHYHILP